MATRDTRRNGLRALIFGAAAAVLYLIMVRGTLAHLGAMTGMVPFDLRPAGYTAEEARGLLDALGEDGRRYYLTRQIPLDLFYPGLLAISLISALRWVAARVPLRLLTGLGIALSLGAALADYLENVGVALMLLRWPDLPRALVESANLATLSKTLLTSLAVAVVIAALVTLAILQGRAWLRRP